MDDFAAAAWVQAYDAAWLGQDWQRLARYLAADVGFMPNDSGAALIGRNATIAHLRAFLARSEVHEYNATDVRARAARGVGFISYRWQLDWTDTGHRRVADGRDLLSLRFIDGGWRMIWRLQLRP
jgi:ketosteroid isomerase-like protein